MRLAGLFSRAHAREREGPLPEEAPAEAAAPEEIRPSPERQQAQERRVVEEGAAESPAPAEVAPPPQPEPRRDVHLIGDVSAAAAVPTREKSAPPPSGKPDEQREGRVLAFANQKGGVAKTTSTLNLAVALSEEGHRVLAVDMDPQGNLTMSQGFNPDQITRSMFDVLVHRLPIDQVIHEAEVDLAVSSIDLAGAELALSSMIGRERSLEKALAPVKGRYDWILVDTPPSLGLLTINALVAADEVIVPVQCEYLSLRGLVQLENTLSMIRENLNPNVAIQGILPTMFDGRTLHSREAIEILQENFGELVFQTRIKKTVRYAEAPVKGSSVLKYDPTGNAAAAYRELAKEVLNGAKARKHA
jgi:chromosome partitioning protein